MRWLRGLDPRLPRDVQLLQLGGLANAFGNGVVLPFMLIYLHNVQGISLGTAGLILATNGFVSIAAGPLGGTLVDRFGGKGVLAAALCFLTDRLRGLRPRRQRLEGVRRRRGDRNRQRAVLARSIDTHHAAHAARAPPQRLRDAARRDEPRESVSVPSSAG